MLGVDLRSTRSVSVRLLAPGGTLLLYTDGMIERRGDDLDAGIERLAEVLRRHVAAPLGELCDQLPSVLDEPQEDDAALLVVRLPS